MEQVTNFELDMLRHQNKQLMQLLENIQTKQQSLIPSKSQQTKESQDILQQSFKIQQLTKQVNSYQLQITSLQSQNDMLLEKLQLCSNPQQIYQQAQHASQLTENALQEQIIRLKIRCEELQNSKKFEISQSIQQGWQVIQNSLINSNDVNNESKTVIIEGETNRQNCEEEEQDKESYATQQTDDGQDREQEEGLSISLQKEFQEPIQKQLSADMFVQEEPQEDQEDFMF
ncbi:hypothetical protein SS50377_23036 [Spironucleus salmonicida]|uniref:Uncharacterized protein n=2 Tax=Spironucleus salmonicida TaxID=348837 RepID=A0A9P8LVZ2_9EUKA|nr:hypothetical protein SS50377_23036 [Spironucleus salmonicida]